MNRAPPHVSRVSLLFAVALLALVAAPGAARAEPAEDEPAFRKVTAERRAGAVIGGELGAGFAGASGYPNNAKLVGDPAYYSASPVLVGTSWSLFLEGAFTDYLSFGPMLAIATFDTPDWRSTGWGVGFRADVFPLVRALPALADTAVYAMAGVGATELRAKGNYPSADGAQSFLGGGVHHELRLGRLLGGHAAAGPYLEYDAIFADSAERHWLSVGLRVAWYGGTVTADRR